MASCGCILTDLPRRLTGTGFSKQRSDVGNILVSLTAIRGGQPFDFSA